MFFKPKTVKYMKEIKTKNCLFKSFNIKNKTKKKPAQKKFIKPKKPPKKQHQQEINNNKQKTINFNRERK